jgi:DNA repair protein RadC
MQDHIIVGGGSYTSMAEKGIIPCQSKGTANYAAIVLGAVPAKERQDRFQDTHSR